LTNKPFEPNNAHHPGKPIMTTATIDPNRWQYLSDLVRSWVSAGHFPAVSLCIGAGQVQRRLAVGRFDPSHPGSLAVTPESPFLVASLTKPVTVAAAMMLVERGLIRLQDRVADFIPGMNQPEKASIRIRHLMNHTSGLPDMLPENDSLRAEHAPLSRFIDGICRCEMLFEPGTQVSYQSMGTALLAEVVQVVTGRRLGEFLRTEIFEPLGMSSTHLGVAGEQAGRVVRVKISPQQAATNWNWNTPYWLGLGAPWGGMTSTAADLARFARLFLGRGVLDGVRILSPVAVQMMTTSQMSSCPKLSEHDRLFNTWGLGWRVQGLGVGTNLGEMLPPSTFGHHGATGTLMLADPARDTYAVILTSRPYDDSASWLMKLSNAISGSFVGG
jgi:CubicO group peptidase (beta-lactamase class C family)